MSDPLARVRGVTRRFGPVVALAGADLELRAGEVHGVLGANGAGKTTLLGVLGGMLRPDAGSVELGGREVVLASPRDAWAEGVVLVHQHFTLVPTLTVEENLALGWRVGGSRGGEGASRDAGGAPRGRRASGARLDLARVRERARALMERTGLRVPLDAPVESIGVGDRQRTEILKALLRDPRVLVLDEPTAVLTPGEIEGLFGLLRQLAGEGRAVALVAHKLDEVLGVADRITVLRAGRTVLTARRAETSTEELVRAMVGSEPADDAIVGAGVEPTGPLAPSSPSTPVARLTRVVARTPRGERALDGVDLEVRRGEVVGVAGVEGNGQHQLALVLSGRMRVDEGTVSLPPAIGYIPQDRTTEGVIADFDLTENTALALQRDPRFRRGPWLRWDELAREAATVRERFRVAAPSVRTRVGDLSGGNQQRVVVGRELSVASDLLVAESPTRGLDVTAAAFVHDELRRLTREGERGPGVVLISTDLDEVLALSDRVFAMARGRLVEVPEAQRTRVGVGALMLAGGDRDR